VTDWVVSHTSLFTPPTAREKLIRLVDLRVWFAACEMVARRCACPAPLPRRFGLDELRRLTGLSPKRLRESLRRLGAARLLGWSESAITFPASPDIVPLRDRDGFEQFLVRIPNHRRLVKMMHTGVAAPSVRKPAVACCAQY
jgi:hypothetical protein